MPRTNSRYLLTVAAGLVLVAACACASTAPYVWVDDAPPYLFQSTPEVMIKPGDVISVRVFGQDPLSSKVAVRSDGIIAMPLIGDVEVAGKLPRVVAKEIEARLVPYVTTPNVTVAIEESRTRIVAIGEIRRPGSLVLEPGETGLLSALANAGGLTEFASESEIYVLRSDSTGTHRIRFRYERITAAVGRAATFKLRNGDQVIVE